MDEMWIYYKAKPHELKNRTKKYNRNHNNFGYMRDKAPKSCLICGKPLKKSEKRLCKSCNGFIRKQNPGNTEKESY